MKNVAQRIIMLIRFKTHQQDLIQNNLRTKPTYNQIVR